MNSFSRSQTSGRFGKYMIPWNMHFHPIGKWFLHFLHLFLSDFSDIYFFFLLLAADNVFYPKFYTVTLTVNLRSHSEISLVQDNFFLTFQTRYQNKVIFETYPQFPGYSRKHFYKFYFQIHLQVSLHSLNYSLVSSQKSATQTLQL